MPTAITFPSVKEIERLRTVAISIVSEETKTQALAHLAKVRAAAKQLKADVAALKQPFKLEIEKIDLAARSWINLLTERDLEIERAVNTYNSRIRKQVQAFNEKALDKYEERVNKNEEKAIEAGKPIPMTLPPALKAEPAKTVEVEGAKVTTVKRKLWKIVGTETPEKLTRADFASKAVPDEYFILDTARIGKVVRAGGSIPGITVYEEETLSVRTA